MMGFDRGGLGIHFGAALFRRVNRYVQAFSDILGSGSLLESSKHTYVQRHFGGCRFKPCVLTYLSDFENMLRLKRLQTKNKTVTK